MRNSIICIAIAFLCVALCASGAQGKEKVITMQLSHFLPATDARHAMCVEWGQELEQKTNGRVKVTVHPGGTLTPPSQTFDSVMRSIVDVGYMGAGMTPGRFPMLEATELPYGNKTSVQATAMTNAFYQKFKPKELNKVKVLVLHSSLLSIHTKKEIRTLEDLKGMKVRTPGGSTTGMLSALGAIPLVISTGDTYDALQKGVADGVAAGPDTLQVFKYGEVVKYTTYGLRGGVGGTTGLIVMNKDLWNSLPKDIQQIIDAMSPVYSQKLAKIFDRLYEDSVKVWEPKGHKFGWLSKAEDDRWAEQLTPVFDKYIKEKTAAGLPAKDAVEFCREWVKKNVK